MKKLKPFFVVAMLVAVCGTLAGCTNRGGAAMPDIIDSYDRALIDFPGSEAAIDSGLERFKAAFLDLTDPDLAGKIRSSYADKLYFNDTLHTFSELEDLVQYMARTGTGLSESSVMVQQVLQDGPDVFVRWTMEFRTRAVGRDIHSRSIGVSHLRFDDEGRVVLHQDFWDSGHGLYAHLPFVGFAVRRAQKAL